MEYRSTAGILRRRAPQDDRYFVILSPQGEESHPWEKEFRRPAVLHTGSSRAPKGQNCDCRRGREKGTVLRRRNGAEGSPLGRRAATIPTSGQVADAQDDGSSVILRSKATKNPGRRRTRSVSSLLYGRDPSLTLRMTLSYHSEAQSADTLKSTRESRPQETVLRLTDAERT